MVAMLGPAQGGGRLDVMLKADLWLLLHAGWWDATRSLSSCCRASREASTSG